MEQPSTQRNLELEAAAFEDLDDLDRWRVFADWLLSQGDARGEIASLAANAGDAFLSERKTMSRRMAELERPFVDAWHEWAQDHDLEDVEVTIKRGFVFGLQGPLGQIRPVIDELFEQHPIQRLSLTDVESDALVDLLDGRPAWLARLRYLKLAGTVDESAAAALAQLALPRLEGLNLVGTGLDAEACSQLARLQTESLERLTLTANEIESEGLRALLGSPTRGRWRELYLSGNPLDADAPAMLAADTGLTNLVGLYMRQIDADLPDFAAFADPSTIPSLRRLEAPGAGYWQHRELSDRLRARFGKGLT